MVGLHASFTHNCTPMNSTIASKTNRVKVLTFSPTGTSRKIAETIAQGVDINNVSLIDITREEELDLTFSEEDLVIVAMPVYGGHVAPIALKRIQNVKGCGALAVAVVVYGNRHYENALNELAAFLDDRNFCVIAAGTFIGEHSYSTPETPIAVGRPDENDLQFAKAFGKKISNKLSSKEFDKPVQTELIEQPFQDTNVMNKFKSTIQEWMKQGVQMPKCPSLDISLCQDCKMCVKLCPTNAIDPLTLDTDSEKCIKCCACVKGCVFHARFMPTPFAPLISENFSIQKENKILL